MLAFQIADSRHPIHDSTGALLHGGRWNSPGFRVIYVAETYAGALLEVLAHSNSSEPPRHHRLVRIEIPSEVSTETVSPLQIPRWGAENSLEARVFGDAWLRSRRTAVLRVPSVVTQGREFNLLLNADHPEFPLIRPFEPEALSWDRRLFGR